MQIVGVTVLGGFWALEWAWHSTETNLRCAGILGILIPNPSIVALIVSEISAFIRTDRHGSRGFIKGESNKSKREQGLVEIHWSINNFKPYVYGRYFTAKTDHRPLTYLFATANPTSKINQNET